MGAHRRQARLLSWLSLAWMTVEGFAGLISGIDAHTLSVLVWASSSLVEGLASITVIWRLTGARTMSAASEQTARRLVAGSCTTSSSIDLVNRPVLVF